MNCFTYKRLWLLTCLLLSLLPVWGKNAYDYAVDDHAVADRLFAARFSAERGAIELRNCVLMSYGGPYSQGFTERNLCLNISESMTGLSLKLYTNGNGLNSSASVEGTTSKLISKNLFFYPAPDDKPNYPDSLFSLDLSNHTARNDDEYWAIHQMFVRVPQMLLQNGRTSTALLMYNGEWDSNDNSDIMAEFHQIEVGLTEAQYTLGTPTIAKDDKGLYVSFPYSRANSGDGTNFNWTTYGNYELVEVGQGMDEDHIVSAIESPDVVSCSAAGNSGTFLFHINETYFDQSHTYYIRHTYAPANSGISYSSEGAKVVVPALVYAKDIGLEYTTSNGVQGVKLTMTTNAKPIRDYHVLDGRIELTLYEGNQNPRNYSASFSYTEGSSTMTTFVPIVRLGNINPLTASDTYLKLEYLPRINTPGFTDLECESLLYMSTYFRQTGTYPYDKFHCTATALTATPEDHQHRIRLKWDYTGYQWTTGTSAELTRYDEVGTLLSTMLITNAEEFRNHYYYDYSVNTCDAVVYKIQVIPGDLAYEAFDAVPSLLTGLHDNPQIYSFQASQGEFAHMVQLNFEADPFDEFVIERLAPDDSDWTIIKTINTPSSNRQYTVWDDDAGAGIIYQYRLSGTKNCAGTEIKTEKSAWQDYGFRRPRGNVAGRITYKDGSEADSVAVRMQPTSSVGRNCLHFGKSGTAQITDTTILPLQHRSMTLQAVVRAQSPGQLIKVPGLLSIHYAADMRPFADLGDQVARAFVPAEAIQGATPSYDPYAYHILTVVVDSVAQLYVDGVLMQTDSVWALGGNFVFGYDPSPSSPITLGVDWQGDLDELRIYDRALTQKEIYQTHNCFLNGNERGLVAYYVFDFCAHNHFFDQSYDVVPTVGNVYHRHHGQYTDGVSHGVSQIPLDLITYAALTNESGIYTIDGIPYFGNGTSYNIVPVKGNHQFLPNQEIRYFSSIAYSHTVDFVDQSSFDVPIRVTYDGGTYPVPGVYFEIDGVAATRDNKTIQTDDEGRATISVPIGVHRVQAKKNGHSFLDDGLLLDVHGQNINYRENLTETQIIDTTRVLFIGRVAGGHVQGDLEVGFGLSKNNLSNYSTVTLRPLEYRRFELHSSADTTLTQHYYLKADTLRYQHRCNLAEPMPNNNDHQTMTVIGPDRVVIHVDSTTGEFFAMVPPIAYTATVQIPGYSEDLIQLIDGHNAELDLSLKTNTSETSQLPTQTLLFECGESGSSSAQYQDAIKCAAIRKYILYVTPELTVTQVDNTDNEVDYFGDLRAAGYRPSSGNSDTLVVWTPESGYFFGQPLVQNGYTYKWRLRMTENYRHSETGAIDRVACENVVFSIENQTQRASVKTMGADAQTGDTLYTFTPSVPNLSTGLQMVSIRAEYGSTNHRQVVAWRAPFDGPHGSSLLYLGSQKKGNDFVTMGPSAVMTVLRDPPGSNSYSYLNKGVTFVKTEVVTAGQDFSFEEGHADETGEFKFIWGPAGFVFKAGGEYKSSGYLVESESYTSNTTTSQSWTTTEKFQTSSNPNDVGADADLYIGTSVNRLFGSEDAMLLVDSAYYRQNAADLQAVYTDTNRPWIVVRKSVFTIDDQLDSTLFAYSQKHILDVLIPRLQTLRNSMILLPINGFAQDSARLDKLCNSTDSDSTIYYLSRISDPNDPDFGTDSTYTILYNPKAWKAEMRFINHGDTIDTLYVCPIPDEVQSYNDEIDNWRDRIRDNEQAKYRAFRDKNYSFNSGSSISYEEGYSGKHSYTGGGIVKVGYRLRMKTKYLLVAGNAGTGAAFSYKMTLLGGAGGSYTNAATRNDAQGFVLADNNYGDYLSVDVCREPDWDVNKDGYYTYSEQTSVTPDENAVKEKTKYKPFIFKTVAGATSCPCEAAEYSKFYKVDGHSVELSAAPLARIVPEIDVHTPLLENVPSGDAAYIQITIGNASEDDSKQAFQLDILPESNPDGLVVLLDGQSLANPVSMKVSPNAPIQRTLTVLRGAVMNYDNIVLRLRDACSTTTHETATATFSVHYIPGCSQVQITQPSNQWTYNTQMPVDESNGMSYMPIILSGFNAEYENLSQIQLQLKQPKDAQWRVLRIWHHDEIAAAGTTLSYNMQLRDEPDGDYELRAVCICGEGETAIETPSDVRHGIKDLSRPVPYGAQQPATGILTAKDVISITFNEPIDQGRISDNNFSILGTLNGSDQGVMSTFVSLDGETAYLQTELQHNLANRNLTMEGNVMLHDWREAPLFSHAQGDNALEMGIRPDHKLEVRFNDQIFVSDRTCNAELDQWAHFALVYDTLQSTVSAYCNGDLVLNHTVSGTYNVTGPVQLGHCPHTTEQYLYADLSTFRIWNYAMNVTHIQQVRNRAVSGHEYSLLASYRMDEGRGMVIQDHTRGVHLMLMGNAHWTLPQGYSLSLDGSKQQYAALNMTTAGINEQSDWTIQFWFRAEPSDDAMMLLTTGEGEGVKNQMGCGLDADGHLYIYSRANRLQTDGVFADGQWHCVGIALSRAKAYVRLYVDGVLQGYDQSDRYQTPQGYLYAGALPQYNAMGALTGVSQYLTGQIDEVQWWELYRTQQQMEQEYDRRRRADERGLLAYWPMQHYVTNQGRQEMDSTLCSVIPDGDRLIPSLRYGGADLIPSPAPTSESRPRDKMRFDYTTTDDAIEIRLTDQTERIEGVETTITVDGIYDLNGNRMPSPVTWTALVRQSQITWVREQCREEMVWYHHHSFTNWLLNTSGSSTYYTITDMPSWLAVDQPSGTLGAGESLMLTFTVDPGLAIGTYTEVIYLSTADAVKQAMHLTLSVRGDKPDWQDQLADLATSGMTVFAEMQMDGVISRDTADMLAAFVGNSCVGVAKTQYVRQLDRYYTLLTIHSNQYVLGQPISFRMWQAATGRSYEGVANRQVLIRPDSVYGSPNAPLQIVGDANLYQLYELERGWNWISFPLTRTDWSLDATLGTWGWQSNDAIKGLHATSWYKADVGHWLGDLQKLSQDSLYMVYTSVPHTYTASGREIDPTQHALNIYPGWNWISYLPLRNLSLQQALAGYSPADGDVIKGAYGFAMYVESVGQWIGSLTYMSPGSGYMLYNGTLAVKPLTYPSTASALVSRVSAQATPAPHTMNLFVEPVEGMSDLYISCGGEIVRPSVVDYAGRQLCVFSLSRTDEASLHFLMTRDGQIHAAKQVIAYQANAVIGTPDEPLLLLFDNSDMPETEGQTYNVLGIPVNDPIQPGVYVRKNGKLFIK